MLKRKYRTYEYLIDNLQIAMDWVTSSEPMGNSLTMPKNAIPKRSAGVSHMPDINCYFYSFLEVYIPFYAVVECRLLSR